MKIEIEREDDGRWIAEVPDVPGVMVYGTTRQEAVAKAEALALRAIADRLDHGEAIPELDGLFAVGMSHWPSRKARGTTSQRLDDQSPGGHIPSAPGQAGLAGLRVCLHDHEEIGPKTLARIATRTGLTPDDL
jgi:predicted RNase H-like HicB family nuclease